MLPRPCLDCGRVGRWERRCDTCETTKQREWSAARDPNTRRHYQGDYRKRAKEVRATPGPCWICGEGDNPSDPWQADHVDAGNPESLLLKAHRSCNIRRGSRGTQSPGGAKI